MVPFADSGVQYPRAMPGKMVFCPQWDGIAGTLASLEVLGSAAS